MTTAAAARVPPSLLRVSEAVAIAVLSAVVGSVSSVVAAERFSSADEERAYLIASDARDRADAAVEEAERKIGPGRDATAALASSVVIEVLDAREAADSSFRLGQYGEAATGYEKVISTLRAECEMFAAGFCQTRALTRHEAALSIARRLKS